MMVEGVPDTGSDAGRERALAQARAKVAAEAEALAARARRRKRNARIAKVVLGLMFAVMAFGRLMNSGWF